MIILTEKCMSCGGCEELCPNDAIHPRSTIEGMYHGMTIDQTKCCNCGVCLEQADCPGNAIVKN